MTGAAATTSRVRPGTHVTPRQLTTALHDHVQIPDGDRFVHLQFRRFAGCPVCNLHLRTFAHRYDELLAAGVVEIGVFHSPATELAAHATDLPIPLIPDPDKHLYREFDVESSPRGMLDPRAWPMIIRALLRSTIDVLRGRAKAPRLFPDGGRYGLPADILLAPDGRVVAAKYGDHIDDHWSVDDVITLARP
ncbi:peroxiredoxin-like family protein [Nitriliruptor alkaliphilus]|uniref:peroxiredoxin-like family protein n=1 Tax=Nitriliruptor alkaliphilus TaxID=427918 RepID=UPI0006961A30|nr:peroxiredoxin-like family protein [Nitriliruptor alkaliphilus]